MKAGYPTKMETMEKAEYTENAAQLTNMEEDLELTFPDNDHSVRKC